MIRFFEAGDKDRIISVWQEAFGDSKAGIEDFLTRFSQYMFVFETDKKAVSMLTLLPVTMNGKGGRYVYAVATDKEYRGRGFAGELLEYAKRFVAEMGESFLTILPQSDSLYGFYKRFGFSELKYAKIIEKAVDLEEKTTLSVKKIDAFAYFEYRKNYFVGKDYVEWDAKMLDFFAKIYNGGFFAVLDGKNPLAAAFCYVEDDELKLSELLPDGRETEVLTALGKHFGRSKISGVSAEKDGERFAMIFPKSFDNCYFGIGMN